MPESGSPLQRTLDRYLETLALTQRPGTVRVNRTFLRGFLRHLAIYHPALSSFSQLQREHIEVWSRHLAAKHPAISNTTRRKYLIAVRIFFERLWAWGWEEAPVEGLIRRHDLPMEDKCLPKPLSWEEDQAIQRELRATGGLIPTGLLLLRATGMRLGELLNLELQAVHEQPEGQWSLKVPLGKLHTERVIPLEAIGAQCIEEILHLRGLHHPQRDCASPDFLLVWPNGRRPIPRSFELALAKAANRAGLKERVWPHRFRHTYATELLRAGMPLPALMKLLGHKTVTMTLRYALVTQTDVRNSYFSTVEKIKGRYEIPTVPARISHEQHQGADTESIVTYLQKAASSMESLRRDEKDEQSRKFIRRLLERLRKLSKELHHLPS